MRDRRMGHPLCVISNWWLSVSMSIRVALRTYTKARCRVSMNLPTVELAQMLHTRCRRALVLLSLDRRTVENMSHNRKISNNFSSFYRLIKRSRRRTIEISNGIYVDVEVSVAQLSFPYVHLSETFCSNHTHQPSTPAVWHGFLMYVDFDSIFLPSFLPAFCCFN